MTPLGVMIHRITPAKLAQIIKMYPLVSAEKFLEHPEGMCLTFDDGFASQLDCLPVLERYGLKAFWFIPTKRPLPLHTDWYLWKYLGLEARSHVWRDQTPRWYHRVMQWVRPWLPQDAMSDQDILTLHQHGQIIGSHTHTHPHQIDQLPLYYQGWEYRVSQHLLTKLLGVRPVVMAHPDGKFSQAGLRILKSLGIRLAFTNSLNVFHLTLCLPRIPHADL